MPVGTGRITARPPLPPPWPLALFPPYPAAQLTVEAGLLYDWRTISYTDGSALPADGGAQRLGSAVYVPAAGPALDPGSASAPGGATHSFDSAGQGPTNTITRAELMAILQALQLSPPPSCVASDSAVALALISKCAMAPGPWLREHKHRDLLLAIDAAIAARPADLPAVELVKVTSHSGVVGNDMADIGAGAAAAGDAASGSAHAYAAAWTDMCWPHTCRVTGDGAARTCTYSAVDGLGAALKTWMTARHGLGTSDDTSYYYRQWRQVAALVDPMLSNAFVHSRAATRLQRRRALLYRTGTLYTGARARMLKRQDSDACRLCGQHDNPHHSVSGCSHLSLLTTARHNAAGRIILQAVRDGSRGAYLVAADFGVLAGADSGLPRAIPTHLLGTTAPSSSRPDIVLLLPAQPARPPTFVCVELKYCCDYRPDHQRALAETQHQALLAALRGAGYDAHTVVLLLGVSGTIYTLTQDLMHTHLGVPKGRVRDMSKQLHLHAVRSLSSIYACKRKLDAAAPPHADRPPPRPPRPPD